MLRLKNKNQNKTLQSIQRLEIASGRVYSDDLEIRDWEYAQYWSVETDHLRFGLQVCL